MFVLPSAQCGGAEKVLLSISHYLPTDLFEPIIVFIDDEGPLLKEISGAISIIRMNRKRVSHSFWPLIKAIRTIHPDVLITSICHLNLAILLIKPFLQRNLKVIIRESNLLSSYLNNCSGTRFFPYLVRWLYPKANSIICLCKEMKDDLIQNYDIPGEKITTIPNPVDISNLRKMKLNEGNPFSKNKIQLLSVGSLTHQKGFDILIDALEMVVSEYSNIHLTILGDGPLKEDLWHLIMKKKLSANITMAGFKENPYPFFYHADKFILSSRYEGLPNVILESVALGTSVIAFDSPGCIRDILGDSTNGVLVSPCTADALARAILQSCKQSIGISMPCLPEKFEPKSVYKKYQDIFLES